MAADGLYRVDSDCRLVPPAAVAGAGWLSGVTHEDLGDGVKLNRFDFVARHEHCIHVEGPSTLCLAIFVGGQGSLAIERGPTLDVRPGVTVLFHAPRAVRGENRVAAGSRMCCLDFRFEPTLLAALGQQTVSGLVRSFQADCSVDDALLVAQPTPGAVAAVARDVLACRLAAPSRLLYLRAKAFEALAHVLAAAAGSDPATVNLMRRDRDRVHHAATLLADRYDEPWTIAALARAVSLNERKLKAGFRALLGRTVHAHLEESRLQAAARLPTAPTAASRMRRWQWAMPTPAISPSCSAGATASRRVNGAGGTCWDSLILVAHRRVTVAATPAPRTRARSRAGQP